MSNPKASLRRYVVCCYVLEATRGYCLSLAYHLVEQGTRNPPIVRHFI